MYHNQHSVAAAPLPQPWIPPLPPLLLRLFPSQPHSVPTPAAALQVRECITTSALLRLPMCMSREQKRRRVEEVITDLVGIRVLSRRRVDRVGFSPLGV